MKPKTTIKIGDRFGRLTAKQFLYSGKHYRRYYLFECDCGNITKTHTNSVTSGNTRSCGCLAREARAATRLPNHAGIIYQIILGYKRHAKERGLKFCLSLDQVRDIIERPCAYCGVEKSNFRVNKNCKEGYSYNGIDRIDSKKNYTIRNVAPSCFICNRAKRDMTQEDFISWIKRAATHLSKS